MLQRQDVTVGKWYVKNNRNVARVVLGADEQTVQFDTYHLNNGNSCGSPSECTRLEFVLWADREVLPSETISHVPVYRGLILLVEDDPGSAMMFCDYLEDNNFQVVVAHNGLEALARASEINPNIILMDWQMPVMDGLEATRHLRADPRFRSIPIIALTAHAMPGARQSCLQAGASTYMSKPVILKQLIDVISFQLTIKDWVAAGEISSANELYFF